MRRYSVMVALLVAFAAGLWAQVRVTAAAGEDIGTKINAAIGSLPNGCGEVDIPAGVYSLACRINVPRCVNLLGQGEGGTNLTWTGGAGLRLRAGMRTAS